MRPRTAAFLMTLLATGLLFGTGSAIAESPGLDQYVETVPGAGGNHATRDNGDNGDGEDEGSGGSGGSSDDSSMPGPTVDSSQLDALRSQGDAGKQAAAALEATSNVGGDNGGGDNGGGSTGAGPDGHQSLPLDSSDADGEAPVEAILSSMFGGGGGGIVLPIIMLAVLVGGLVMAARAHRGSIGS